MERDQFSADALLGAVIDNRFEILEKLGAGGMGAIYKARQISVDRVVALKILLHDQRGDPISVERFRHEAYLASRLKHPNTIVIHDFGQTADGLLYIAMEFLPGETLKQRLRRIGPFNVDTGVKIMTQGLRPIAEAHRVGMVHRDLKPDNIFLTVLEGDSDYVKVLDFGIAKLTAVQDGVEGYQGGLTVAGKIYGTPNYMSPEQIRGKTVDQQSDIYSLGVIFYEILVGHLPFAAPTPVDVMMMHLRDAPASLVQQRPEIPVELERTVLRALEKDRRARYHTADEFLESLENYKINSGFYAVPAQLVARAATATAEEESEPLSETVMLTQAQGATPVAPEPVPPEPVAPEPVPTDAVDEEADYGSYDDDATVMGLLADDPMAAIDPAMAAIDLDEKTVLELQDDSEAGQGSEPGYGDSYDDSDVFASVGGDEDSLLMGPVVNVSRPGPAGERTMNPDELTMLELDDDDMLEEVEPSRLVPIPDFDDSSEDGRSDAPPAREPLTRTRLGMPVAQISPAPPAAPRAPAMEPVRAAPRAPAMTPPRAAPRAPAMTPSPAPRTARPAPAVAAPSAPRAPAAARRPPLAAVSTQPGLKALQVSSAELSHREGGAGKIIAIILGLLVAVGAAAAVIFLDPFGGGEEAGGGTVAVKPRRVIGSQPPDIEIFDAHGRFVETGDYSPDGKPEPYKIVDGKRIFKATIPPVEGERWLFFLLPPRGRGRRLGVTTIRSEPPGATVKVGGRALGHTPLTYVGDPKVKVKFDVERSGHGAQQRVHAPAEAGDELRVELGK